MAGKRTSVIARSPNRPSRAHGVIRLQAWRGAGERDDIFTLDDDRTLVFGREPQAPRTPDFLAGRDLRLITTPAGRSDTRVSRRQLALYPGEGGALCAAALGKAHVWIQPWGSQVRETCLASWPGEVLPSASTLWFPPTSVGLGRSSSAWQVAVYQPLPVHRPKALGVDGTSSDHVNTTSSDDVPRPTEGQLEAIIKRYREYLIFPPHTMRPATTGRAENAEERRMDRRLARVKDAVERYFAGALVSSREDAIARLIEAHAVTLPEVHSLASRLDIDLGSSWLVDRIEGGETAWTRR
jgi:hypothetical protein